MAAELSAPLSLWSASADHHGLCYAFPSAKVVTMTIRGRVRKDGSSLSCHLAPARPLRTRAYHRCHRPASREECGSDTNSFALSCGTNLPKLAQSAGARVNDLLAPGCMPCGIRPGPAG